MRFKDLAIGDTFDFVDDAKPLMNSFFNRCKKTSARSYTWKRLIGDREVTLNARVGSWTAEVFHVNEREG